MGTLGKSGNKIGSDKGKRNDSITTSILDKKLKGANEKRQEKENKDGETSQAERY